MVYLAHAEDESYKDLIQKICEEEEEKRIIAEKLKSAGIPLDTIVQSTGLTLAEVEAL